MVQKRALPPSPSSLLASQLGPQPQPQPPKQPLGPPCCCVMQEHIKREKVVMAECASPFLVNLLASFKDPSHLYMVMEVVQGGEFFTYLQASPGVWNFVVRCGKVVGRDSTSSP